MKNRRSFIDPITQMRFARFRKIKRGWWSFLLLCAFILISLFSELLMNSRALIVWYEGKLYLPTYGAMIAGTKFNLGYQYETNYRELSAKVKKDGTGWVLMPLVRYNPYEQDFMEGSYPPYAPSLTSGHILGTDKIGRDVAARLLYGFRVAIFFALAFVLVTYIVGISVGCLMGYRGKSFDIILQRIIEVIEQVPFIYIVMIIAAIFRPSIVIVFTLFVLFGWSARTWSARAMTYRERERDYVLAARTMGASTSRIIRVHIIPNILVIIISFLPFSVAGGISTLAALDFLGFGPPPPTPSWGELLNQGFSSFDSAPWILFSVLFAMTVILVMIAFIGESLRDAFDPRKFSMYR